MSDLKKIFTLVPKESKIDEGMLYFKDSKDNLVYNTRVLLDTGSSVNWVAPTLLKYIEYQNICSKQLEVNSFNNTERVKYRLIEIQINNKKLHSLRCFVMKKVSGAQIIVFFHEYIQDYASKFKINIDRWCNPYDSTNIDHDEIGEKTFFGLIISGNVINQI